MSEPQREPGAPNEPANEMDSSSGDGGSANGAGRVLDAGKRKPLLLGLLAAVVVIGLGYWLYATFIGSRSVSTDNAYVAADNAQITPLTAGQILSVDVVDTQAVRKGQVLMRLDSSDQEIAVAQAEATLALAQRRYQQSQEQVSALGATAEATSAGIGEAEARLATARAEQTRAQADYRRRTALVGSGAVSGEEVTTARNDLAAAQAAVREAEATIAQTRAQAESARRNQAASRALIAGTSAGTAPEVRAAQARLAQARLDLQRTVIRSPIDGVIAQRNVEVGQRAETGKVAMIVVPIDRLYVDANFKENQLGKVRPGQQATLTSDFYGDDVEYHGRVVGFAGGTGAAFALIPAQNATGNWIKVVQRLPVRIALDPRELRAHPLRVGLSMEAEIDLTDHS